MELTEFPTVRIGTDLTRLLSNGFLFQAGLAEHLQFGEKIVLVSATGELFRCVNSVREGSDSNNWSFVAYKGAFHGVTYPEDSILTVLKSQHPRLVAFSASKADGKLLQATGDEGLHLQFQSHYLGQSELWRISGRSFHRCWLVNSLYPDKKLLVTVQRVLTPADDVGDDFPDSENVSEIDAMAATQLQIPFQTREQLAARVASLQSELEESMAARLALGEDNESLRKHVATLVATMDRPAAESAEVAAESAPVPAESVHVAAESAGEVAESAEGPSDWRRVLREKLQEMERRSDEKDEEWSRRVAMARGEARRQYFDSVVNQVQAAIESARVRRGTADSAAAAADSAIQVADTAVAAESEEGSSASLAEEREEEIEQRIAAVRRQLEVASAKRVADKLSWLDSLAKGWEERLGSISELHGQEGRGSWETEWRVRVAEEKLQLANAKVAELASSLRSSEVARVGAEETRAALERQVASLLAELRGRQDALRRLGEAENGRRVWEQRSACSEQRLAASLDTLAEVEGQLAEAEGRRRALEEEVQQLRAELEDSERNSELALMRVRDSEERLAQVRSELDQQVAGGDGSARVAVLEHEVCALSERLMAVIADKDKVEDLVQKLELMLEEERRKACASCDSHVRAQSSSAGSPLPLSPGGRVEGGPSDSRRKVGLRQRRAAVDDSLDPSSGGSVGAPASALEFEQGGGLPPGLLLLIAVAIVILLFKLGLFG